MQLTFSDRPAATGEYIQYLNWKRQGSLHALVEFLYLRSLESVSRDQLYAMDVNELLTLGAEACKKLAIGDSLSVLTLAWDKVDNSAYDTTFAQVLQNFSQALGGTEVTGRDLVLFVEELERRKRGEPEPPPTIIKPTSVEQGARDVPVNRPQNRDEALDRWRKNLDHEEDASE